MKRLVIVLILFAKIGISQDTLAFELLNKYRAYHNKSALVMNTSFAEYAINHCEEMASKNKIWHTNNFPSHKECVIGKHLYGYDHSPSHKKILLADDNINGYFHINIDKLEKKYDPFAKLTYYDIAVNSCVNINR